MNDINQLLNAVTPEIYQRFKTALEIRKWPDGRPLTKAQIETVMQAIIAYELTNLAAEERTGFVPPKKAACAHPDDDENPLKWQ